MKKYKFDKSGLLPENGIEALGSERQADPGRHIAEARMHDD
jgi:hypothetical protein